MKVAFDHHVPPAVAKVFLALANERAVKAVSFDLILERSEKYEPKITDGDYIKGSDAPWLDRFAAAGGRAVISGDVKMRVRHHEKLALYQNGFVTIFFQRKWNQWNFFRKSALLLHWWEEIVIKMRTADKGTFWEVPCAWPPKGEAELMNVSFGLAKLLQDNPARRSPRATPRNRVAKRPAKPADPRQDGFLDDFDAT